MPQFKNVWKKSIFHFEKRSKFASAQINITPLIDVVFLLLIFFMITSTFVSQAGIKVDLPKAVSGKTLLDNRLVITIDNKDQVFINDENIKEKDLMIFVRNAAKDNKTILIMADKSSSMGKIVEVWDMCRQAEVAQINIATKTD
ncbi:MAG: biopolymer transporter ExbD [Candidatus Omnitrophota bacterium]